MYFVYLARCKDKSIYTGITNDLSRRLKQHQNRKGGHYTSAHPVEKIMYTERYRTKGKALKREAEIKNWSRKKKLNLVKK